MSFGKIIKRLRREKNMTQEKLAEILSISPQAVSRWETEVAMPDISLIAPLCNLFNVAADDLLEIDVKNKQLEIDTICEESDKLSARGYLNKAREILQRGLKRHPENCEIIYRLMYLSFSQYNSIGNCKYRDECIKWGEKILEQSLSNEHRQGAIQVLCFSYSDAGRIDDAVRMAECASPISASREMLLSRIYSGDEQYKAKQIETEYLLQFLSNSLYSLQTKLDNGENAYTDEEYSRILDKRIKLFQLFFENGDFGFYHTHLCDTHAEQAACFSRNNKEDEALKHLRLASEHAIRFITAESENRTSLVFRYMVCESMCTNTSENDAARLLNKMNSSDFDYLRGMSEFQEIYAKLSLYSEK